MKLLIEVNEEKWQEFSDKTDHISEGNVSAEDVVREKLSLLLNSIVGVKVLGEEYKSALNHYERKLGELSNSLTTWSEVFREWTKTFRG